MSGEEASTGPVDWRGTPITPGALVIYGGPVGRSIQMVEATVADPMLTPSGRIWLNVVRRSYDDDSDGRVHVGADRLVVVGQLPPTALPTATEVREKRERWRVTRDAYMGSAHEHEQHPGPVWGEWREPEPGRIGRQWLPCTGCVAAVKRFDELWQAGEIT